MIKNYLLLAALLIHPCVSYAQTNSTRSKSEIKGPLVWKSNIYPGTERNYWIYIPKEYDSTKPACTMIVQDGLSRAIGWNLPAVMDSLITLKEMPVTIGIFIDHGKVISDGTDTYPRYNRSFEYDAMGNRYANFLLEELLPEVSKTYNLSSDPNDRSIAGASSGAISAFNVAWERPDAFRRVLSTIGTYVGLRGADEFATLVRKTEPKPLRVFLEDGDHDLNIYAGDWWVANQNMLSALTWAGYEVNHEWGTGGHDSKHARTILADALKWLWKDYPKAIEAHPTLGKGMNPTLEGEPWKEIKTNNIKINKLALNKAGEFFFTANHSVYTVNESANVIEYLQMKGEVGGICFATDGSLYAGNLTRHTLEQMNDKQTSTIVLKNVDASFITSSGKGIYFSDKNKKQIGFYSFLKKAVEYTSVPESPTGLSISAEQTFLNVGLSNYVFGYSFKIKDDGSLAFGQDYTHYHIPYGATSPATEGMAVDSENLLYSATAIGIQVSDQLGRVNYIFSQPKINALDVNLGGKDFDTLFANFNGKLYSRKIKAKGLVPGGIAVKPQQPRM